MVVTDHVNATAPAGPAPLPLTAAQREFWLAQQLAPASPAYNLAASFEIRGRLDVAAFDRAARVACAEAESLRVRIVEPTDDGEPRQVVDPVSSRPTPVIDLSAHPEPGRTATLYLDDDLEQALDPTEGAMTRHVLLRIAPDVHRWYLRMHHLAMDGYGTYLIGRRLADLYTAAVTGVPTRSGPFPAFADLVRSDLAYRDSGELDDDRAYWVAQCTDLPEIVSPATRAARGPRHGFRTTAYVAGADFEQLQDVARDAGVRWPAAVTAGVAVYLGKTLGTGTVQLGMTVTGRASGTARRVPGQQSNVVPLRLDVPARHTTSQLLARCDAVMADALGGQRYRGEDIRRDTRSTGADPLQGWHVNINPFDYAFDLAGVDVRMTPLALGPVDDVIVYVYPDATAGGLRIDFDANPDRYTPAEAQAHLQHVLTTIRNMTRADLPIGVLDPTDADERRQLLSSEWNTSVFDPPARTATELFEAQVRLRPEAPAVTAGADSVDYAELNRRSNRLARMLVATGVRVDDVVGVAVPRSVEMIVAVLAVLKAGAAYLPIDLDYPPERVRHIVEDSAVSFVLTTADGARDLPTGIEADLVFLDSAPVQQDLAGRDGSDLQGAERSVPLAPANLAYVIYTSGSTGRPKGVAVTHRSVTNYVTRAVTAYPSLARGVLLYSSLSFDITLTALFGALAAGGHLIVSSVEEYADGHTQDGYAFLKATPTHLALLDALPDLCAPDELFIVAGEPLVGEMLTDWRERHPDVHIVNHYGPSECTCGCIDHHVAPAEPIPSGPVPIGRPFADTRLYVLDAGLRPVPVGVVGELYIAGNCLGRGYLNRAALTSERFVACPFEGPGARMYRSGDTVRWTADGRIEFVGRADHQVKLHGYRVELGEVQAAIAATPDVSEVIVVVGGERSAPHLVAYLSPAPGATVDTTALRTTLAQSLPSFMVPAFLVVLDALPRTPNGKIDRRALPAAQAVGTGVGPGAATPVETEICTALGTLLGVTDVGPTDGFSDLGGDSLHAVKLAARLTRSLGARIGVRDVFERQTARALAELAELAGADAPIPPVVEAADRPRRIPLAPQQRRLWFLNQSDAPRSLYNIPYVVRLDHGIDVAALGLALADVVERHSLLRTIFPADAHGPHQVVVDIARTGFAMDVRPATADTVDALAAQESRRPFDVTCETPLRAVLFELGRTEHVLLVVLHHIAGDGWSFGPFGHDLELAYAARSAGRDPVFEPLADQYADYAVRQDQRLPEGGRLTGELAKQASFWAEALADLPEELRLPTDRPRPPEASYRGGTEPVWLPAALHRAVRGLAGDEGVTVFMVLQAALAALLTRLGAGTDIPIGAGVAGRTDDRFDRLIGFFINTLVLRTDVTGDPSFRELLARVRRTDLAAFDHQDLPFERVVELVNPVRSPARQPLFQTLLMLRNTPRSDLRLTFDGRTFDGVEIPIGFAKFDLVLSLVEQVDGDGAPIGIEGFLEYSTDLFDSGTAATMVQRYLSVLSDLVADPNRTVGAAQLFLPDERELLDAHGRDDRPVPIRTVPQLLAEQVARCPDAVAITDGAHSVAYADLDRRVNRLARWLIAQGVGPEQTVAIAVPRSLDMVVAVLAVTVAGGAYLPIDLDYPPQRIEFMLSDTEPVVVLTTRECRSAVSASGAAVALDDGQVRAAVDALPGHAVSDAERLVPLHPAHPVCVLYTSGSTGRPKGAQLTHAGMASFVAAQPEIVALTPSSRVLQFGSPSFDAFLLELCQSVLNGACLVVRPADDVALGDPLVGTVDRLGVTHVTMPPSALAVLRPGSLPDTMTLTVAGESVPGSLVRTWSPGRRMVNLYGPTECTTVSTWSAPLGGVAAPPIGRVRRELTLHVLDDRLQPVPVGVPGELYVAGDGLARGYRARPGLTASRFVANPFDPGTRMYRTGDVVRWLGDGTLRFVARTDHQVKVRGFRIEPGEIEQCLASFPGIRSATVVVRDDQPDNRQLVAYLVTPDPAAIDPAEVRQHCAKVLPSYMVPNLVVPLVAVPVTPNGKIDRARLPAPERPAGPADDGDAAAGELQDRVAAIWAEVLGRSTVGPDEHFFDLGGHSLVAARVVNRLREIVDVDLSIRLLFEHPTVAALTGKLEQLRGDGVAPAPAGTPGTGRSDPEGRLS